MLRKLFLKFRISLMSFSDRIAVADNPNTPTKTLELLATDKDSDVRWWVARNPNTPKYIKILNRYKNYLRSL